MLPILDELSGCGILKGICTPIINVSIELHKAYRWTSYINVESHLLLENVLEKLYFNVWYYKLKKKIIQVRYLLYLWEFE